MILVIIDFRFSVSGSSKFLRFINHKNSFGKRKIQRVKGTKGQGLATRAQRKPMSEPESDGELPRPAEKTPAPAPSYQPAQ
jgi:hypothetical protein